MRHSPVSVARRFGGAVALGAFLAGCSTSSTPPAPSAGASVRQNQLLAAGRGVASQPSAQRRAWISPDAKRKAALLYWGNYYNSTITIYSAKGTNGPQKGQITSGLSNPERLFADESLSVYATNLGNNTITAYKRGATTPFLTIGNGVNSPTGLTVDAAGTVYCANVGNNTVTEYPKGQTSPSITIAMGTLTPEWLAMDASDNLYVSYSGGSHGSGVMKYSPGSTHGTDLGLNVGSAWAVEVDSAGNVILIDFASSNIDVFSPGQTNPSKQIPVTAGTPFALSLSKSETKLYVTVEISGGFEVQQLNYPNGTSLSNKLTTNAGNWPIAVSPDTVL